MSIITTPTITDICCTNIDNFIIPQIGNPNNDVIEIFSKTTPAVDSVLTITKNTPTVEASFKASSGAGTLGDGNATVKTNFAPNPVFGSVLTATNDIPTNAGFYPIGVVPQTDFATNDFYNVVIGREFTTNDIGLNGGGYNVFIGKDAGINSINNGKGDSGAANIALGIKSLETNVNGDRNIAIGALSLKITNNDDNIGIGVNALENNDGIQNIAIGNNAFLNSTNISNNIGIGINVFEKNTSGALNIAIGNNAFIDLVNGANNIGIGMGAFVNLVSNNDDNIGIGHNVFSGFGTTGLKDNISIGNNTVCNTNGLKNTISIGNSAIVTNDGELSIRTDSLTTGAPPGKATTNSLKITIDGQPFLIALSLP